MSRLIDAELLEVNKEASKLRHIPLCIDIQGVKLDNYALAKEDPRYSSFKIMT